MAMANGMTRAVRLLLPVVLAILAGCATTGSPHLDDALAHQKRAEQAYDAGNLAQAQSEYQALTRALPLNADYWFRLGNVCVRMDQPDEAVDAYSHALQREPKHAKAWHNLGIVRLRQAAAAFTEGARSATGVDAGLQQESADMAHGIAKLSASAPAEQAAPVAAETAPDPEKGP